jgi:hypothetical protein
MAEGKAARALLSRSRQGGLAPLGFPSFKGVEGVGAKSVQTFYSLPR